MLFRFNRGKCSSSFGSGNFVRCIVTGKHQQSFSVRGRFKNGDPHIVDHLDNVFDLFRISYIFRKMVVNLCVGEVALFTTFSDKIFDAGLLFLSNVGHSALVLLSG